MKTKMPLSPTDFHLGQCLKAELARQGRTATWLAKQVHCTPENIYKAYRSQWISMPLLFVHMTEIAKPWIMTSLRTARRIWRQRKLNNRCGFMVKSFSFCGKMR